ncbi:MAG: lipopolysaccharide biosynthesis protein [Pseudoxanthomonas sp.]
MARIEIPGGRLMANGIVKQFSTVLAGRLLSAGIQAASILLLAKWVSVESFGLCVALLGLMTALQTLGDVGVTTFVTKEVAAHGHNARVLAAQRMSRRATTALALAGFIACTVLAAIDNLDFALTLPLWGWLLVERVTEIHIAVAMGQQRPHVAMLSLVIRRVLSLALFCLLFSLGVTPLLAFSAGYLFGSLLALPLSRMKGSEADSAGNVAFRDVFTECRHYWIHSFSLQARNVDTFLVGMVSGPAQAAFYGFGARLLTPLRMVPTALASIMLPHSARSGSSAMPGKKLAAIALLLSIPYLGLMLLWPLLIPWLFASEYTGAILPLQIMSAALSLTSCTSIVSAVLQGWGHGARVSRISATATTATLLLVTAGSSLAGATGAATGFAIAACTHVVLVVRAYLHARGDHE